MNFKIYIDPSAPASFDREYYFDQLQYMIDVIESYDEVHIEEYDTTESLNTFFSINIINPDVDEVQNLYNVIIHELKQKFGSSFFISP